MSAMVERVAAAIWALNENTDCNDYSQLSAPAKKRADGMAIAAIQAMREPTDGMLDYRDAGVKKHDALLVWQHQIDEALK